MGAEHYDVLVVGAGSAGCVLATRLATAGSRSVCLLEAGPDLRAEPPALMHDGWRTYRDCDWGLLSERDHRGEVEPLFRGKVVGGSGWMTRFVIRGSRADFDGWAGAGCPGWGFDDVLESFRRVEHDLDFGVEPWHGDSGPLPVTRYPQVEPSPFESALADACSSSGIPLIEDHNRPEAEGAARMPRNGFGGRRVTSADAYLAIGAASANLTVRPNAEVASVVLDHDRAVGVRLRDGTDLEAGWVVLCAGTYGSPVILMRSGIGDPDHLRDTGLAVRCALPGVGSNLADHQGFDVDVGYRGEPGVGPRFFWLATLRSSRANPGEPPDIGLWVPEPFGIADEPAQTDVTGVLLTPRSRGSVRLRSADPASPPAIRLPGLQHSSDVDLLAEATMRAREVAAQGPLRRICADGLAELPTSIAELRSVVAAQAWSFPHTVGTCAMGPSTDGGAVVDAQGKVYGVAGLSVADASVIPTAPSGFPHVIALMIAERMAEILRDQL